MSKHPLKTAAHTADEPTRRAFACALASRLLGVTVGLGCTGILRSLAATTRPALAAAGIPVHTPRGRTKSVIYLFMRGGMSHLDTLDPKPGARTQGPTQTIRTRADGVRLGHYFEKLAEQMDKAVIVRSMTSKQGAHPQAQYLLRTSYEQRGTIQHPSLGGFVNLLAGKQNATLPGHVIIGGGSDMPSAGFLPPHFAALPIGDPDSGLQNARLPLGINDARFEQRMKALAAMNQSFQENHAQREVKAYSDLYAEAVRLMRSEDLAAFDIEVESAAMHAAYGADNPFGAGCLLARRLVEHGVRFIEIVSDGWDTHADNFDRLDDLTPSVDQGLAALLADLDGRGLLEETMVVLATEFGRTPDIDQDQGRNHFPKAFSCLLAGGGIHGGSTYGSTDDEGREVRDNPVTIQDFNATIAANLGLPLSQVVVSPSGRPFTLADKGQPIDELVA
jgi:uncharacterized protein (DUF1501 family)